MRIAQVSHSLDCGGSMALMAALSCNLAKCGHEVDVVCMDRRSGSAHEALWIERLGQRGIAVHFLGRKPERAGTLAAAKLWWMVQRRRYHVLHSHLPMPDAMGGLVRRLSIHPFLHVVTVHNTYEPRSRALEALASGAHVVYCSESVRNRNPLPGISSTIISNGIIETDSRNPHLSRRTIRQELGLHAATKIVIWVGRLCPQKNFAATIQALAVLKTRNSIPDLHCLVCGDGPERAELEDRVRDLGLEGMVHFMGARTDMPVLLQASDAFLSTSRHEGMPLSVLEALSAGLPCVLSDIPEHHELAGPMPFCVFVSYAPESIAAALEATLHAASDPHLIRRQRAMLLEKHSIEKCADSYQRHYEACCGLAPRARLVRS